MEEFIEVVDFMAFNF